MGFLTGKTALITGAGRAVLQDGSCGSIGYGLATAYAKEGANLVITGRNVKKLEEAKDELEQLYGIKVLPVQADVCAGGDNEATVQNVVKQAMETFRRHSGAYQQRTGIGFRRAAGRQHDWAIQSGSVFRSVRRVLLYESVLSLPERIAWQRHQLCVRCGPVRQLRPKRLCRRQGRHPGLSRVAATEWGPDGINVNVVCPLADGQAGAIPAAYRMLSKPM